MRMQRDFTFEQYEALLRALLFAGFECCTVDRFFSDAPSGKTVILRHDIDKRPENALKTAQIETRLHIEATYYFRAIDSVFDPQKIKQIADLGHEIGYHYEELSLCRGNIACAIDLFEKNLARFRKITPVGTICMHGSPLSKWDNRDLWKTYDYREYGIIAEPYFDMDFHDFFYLTDTGRRWDGDFQMRFFSGKCPRLPAGISTGRPTDSALCANVSEAALTSVFVATHQLKRFQPFSLIIIDLSGFVKWSASDYT